MSIQKRKGVLTLSSVLLEQMQEAELRELFSNFFPVLVTPIRSDVVEYRGLSPYFREIENGERIPQYDAVFERDSEGVGRLKEFREWQR